MHAAVTFACVLLLAGLFLRRVVPGLSRYAIPASVIGGILGLVALQTGLSASTSSVQAFASKVSVHLGPWPSMLIAVVFAGLLLARTTSDADTDSRPGGRVIRAGLMVWIIVFGQAVLGMLLTLLVLRPIFDVPGYFGQLIETGFAGGHGTAAAMGEVFASDDLGFPEGRDLGQVMATIGLVYSIVSGLLIVQVAPRFSARIAASREGLRSDRPLPDRIGRPKVHDEALDPLALQIAFVGLAFGIGVLLQWGVASGLDGLRSSLIAANGGSAEAAKFLASLERVPLFLFTLIGGGVVRASLGAIGCADLLDPETLKRIMGVAMDFLIVAAIATIRIEVVSAYAGPLALLLALGFAWTGLCLLVLSRPILARDDWFELGLINYGMSTGTTAQGMMLLRIVDPELRTNAASDYALAAPLSAPFIGGGLLTLAAPILILQVGLLPLTLGGLVCLAGLIAIGLHLGRRARAA